VLLALGKLHLSELIVRTFDIERFGVKNLNVGVREFLFKLDQGITMRDVGLKMHFDGVIMHFVGLKMSFCWTKLHFVEINCIFSD
jgi:hypothetical protein